MNLIQCSMCGHQFDPANHASCQSCPLQKGCQLVCCPVCGFESVDPSKSTLARFAEKIISWRNNNKSPEEPEIELQERIK